MRDAEPTGVQIFDSGHAEVKEISAHLRWSRAGKLQQGWAVTRIDALGNPIARHIEWRDVPTEE